MEYPDVLNALKSPEAEIMEFKASFREDGHTYFACVNEKIKNFIVQESSKYCFKKNISTLIIYVTTIKEMEEGKDFNHP